MKKIVITSVLALALASTLTAGVVAGKCMGCHGKSFEKKAMGRSAIVAEMTHANIAVALKGYKDGSYGGPMKGLMKGQVARYSDADLDAFSHTIGK